MAWRITVTKEGWRGCGVCAYCLIIRCVMLYQSHPRLSVCVPVCLCAPLSVHKVCACAHT